MNCQDTKMPVDIPHHTDEITPEWARQALVGLSRKLQRKANEQYDQTGRITHVSDFPDMKRMSPLSNMLFDAETRNEVVKGVYDVQNPDHFFDIDYMMLPEIKRFVNGRYKLFQQYGLLPSTFVAHGDFSRFQNDRLAVIGKLDHGFFNGWVQYMDAKGSLTEMTYYEAGSKQRWSVAVSRNEFISCAYYVDDACVFGATVHPHVNMLVVDSATGVKSGKSFKYDLTSCQCLLQAMVKKLFFIEDKDDVLNSLNNCSLHDVCSLFDIQPYV